MALPSSKPSRIFEFPSADALCHLQELLQSDSMHPAVVAETKRLITRHVRITHPDDLPIRPVDTALLSRVAALEKKATELSAQVEAARANVVTELEETLSERVKELNEIPHCPPPKPIASPPYQSLTTESVELVRAVGERVESVKQGAESTRKRTKAVREVLRIIGDNVQLTIEETQSIAQDWTATFSDLKRKRDSPAATPEEDRVPGEDRVFCPISPHITPRSKMRRKAAMERVRQPQFGGSPMPR